jgi:hypothetical protein
MPSHGIFYVAVDFDGTLVDHRYPEIGDEAPHAVRVVQRLIEERQAKIILYTMRSGETLDAAVEWCNDRGIELFGVNHNPTQREWSDSPKAYAKIYIDDAAFGCPLVDHPEPDHRPMVDWLAVESALLG